MCEDDMLIQEKYRGRLEAGMLDYIQQLGEPPGDGHQESIAEQRQRYSERCAAFGAPRAAGVDTQDETLPGAGGPIPIRVYATAAAQHGCVLYMHGGGWVVGDLDSHDDICSEIAVQTGAQVVAIDYRRVPEHTYPAAFDDCCAVLDYLRDNPARFGTRLVVAGDSAGGNLA
ncbi:MAG: alpha/beta hydrolase, partial [Gammaproteobacteria bacterium]|nr:alpha/beta hydrolase [Gammaproteobacteria bacterium]